IFSSKLSYEETIFYKIEKFNDKSNLIQTFYVVNIPGIDILKYIDTQIKPYKLYSYQISAIKIVVGTKYKYKNSLGDLNNVPRSENDLGQAIIPQSNPVVIGLSDDIPDDIPDEEIL